MIVLADKSLEEKQLDVKAISGIEGRKFLIIPAAETPICKDVVTGEEVEYLAAIRIDL